MSCPEEIAYRTGFIGRDDLVRLGVELERSAYGRYLLSIAEEATALMAARRQETPIVLSNHLKRLEADSALHRQSQPRLRASMVQVSPRLE